MVCAVHNVHRTMFTIQCTMYVYIYLVRCIATRMTLPLTAIVNGYVMGVKVHFTSLRLFNELDGRPQAWFTCWYSLARAFITTVLRHRYCVIVITLSLHVIGPLREWIASPLTDDQSRELYALAPRVPGLPCHMINPSLSISLYYDSSPDTVMYKTSTLLTLCLYTSIYMSDIL